MDQTMLEKLQRKWDVGFDAFTRLMSKGLAAAAFHPKTSLAVLVASHVLSYVLGLI